MTGKRPVGYGRGAMMRCASAYDALGGSAVGVPDDVYSGLGLSRVDAAAAERLTAAVRQIAVSKYCFI